MPVAEGAGKSEQLKSKGRARRWTSQWKMVI